MPIFLSSHQYIKREKNTNGTKHNFELKIKYSIMKKNKKQQMKITLAQIPAQKQMNNLINGLNQMNKEGFFDILALNEEAWELYATLQDNLVKFYYMAGGVDGCHHAQKNKSSEENL